MTPLFFTPEASRRRRSGLRNHSAHKAQLPRRPEEDP